MAYLSPGLLRVAEAFMEALLPDEGDPELIAARRDMGRRFNEVFDPARFDSPTLQGSVPWILRLIQWAPVLFWWLSWRPLPFTWLSLEARRRFLERMERSRLYGVRGLFMVAKLLCSMVYFDDRRTWAFIGYDGQGLLPLEDQQEAAS